MEEARYNSAVRKELHTLDVFEMCDLQESGDIKFYRHSDQPGWPVEELERSGDLELFQRVQSNHQLGDNMVAFFIAEGKLARFYGLYKVASYSKVPKGDEDFVAAQAKGFWKEGCIWYSLTKLPMCDVLRNRLVIRWPEGRSHHRWFRRANQTSSDFEFVEIRASRDFRRFDGYWNVILDGLELYQMINAGNTATDWKSALSSTKGVYLISDLEHGHLYVGSATGSEGFYGRWKNYADNLHGGNKLLRIAVEEQEVRLGNFQISILETLSSLADKEEGLAAEIRWKKKLGRKAITLNGN